MPATAYLPYMTALAAAFASLAGVLLGRAYWRRRRRLRLRLIRGRRSLLDREIEASDEHLAELEGGDIATVRAAAEDALNSLHASLLDRQAHLQNCEDLASLQVRKIAALQHHLGSDDLAGAATPQGAEGTHAEPVDSDSPGEHRERVQADLLRKIQKAQGAPPGSGD